MQYGERHNDDFLVSYGFAPIGNPHDDVLLFPDLVAALEWYFDRSAVAQVLQAMQYRSTSRSINRFSHLVITHPANQPVNHPASIEH